MTELQPRVTRGQTLIEIPYNGDYLRFVHPGEGPDTYQNVFSALTKRDLALPTGEQTAFLLDAVYNHAQLSQESEAQGIRKIMKSNWVWVANRNLWVPESNGYKGSAGVYVAYDKQGKGISEKLNIRKLEQSLEDSVEIEGVRFSKDKTVAFAPRDTYNGREQTPEDFSKDGFIRASYGIEGAKKLSDVSKQFSSIPRVWIVDNPTNCELRVSALVDCYGRLNADGIIFGGNWDGHALGICELTKSAAA